MLITLNSFTGAIPRLSKRLLKENQSQAASNAYLFSGELRPFDEDFFIQYLENTEHKTVYKYSHPDDGNIWLTWGHDVDIVKGPVANDIHNRLYFVDESGYLRTSDSTMIDVNDITIDSTNSIKVGIETPVKATLTVSGTGTGTVESRVYAYCYVREFDDGKLDIGKLSLPATNSTDTSKNVVDVVPGQIVTMTGIKEPTATDCGIDWIYVYRSATGSSNTTYKYTYKFPANHTNISGYSKVTWNAGTSSFSFADDITDINLGEDAVSTSWNAPEEDIEGITSLQNGCVVAYKGNQLMFSEPYQAHAWPSAYTVTLDYKIKGLGSFGNTVVVCTDAYPFVCTVQDPSSVIPKPINEHAPCLAKKSIVASNGAVYYASVNGIMRIDAAGLNLATKYMFSREDWQLLNPSSMIGTLYRGAYVAFFDSEDVGYNGIFIDFNESSLGITMLTPYISAMFTDVTSDDIYIVYKRENEFPAVYRWNAKTSAKKAYSWRSKEFVSTEGLSNFSAARVDFHASKDLGITMIPNMDDALGGFSQVMVNRVPVAGDKYTYITTQNMSTEWVKFSLYCDGKLVYEKDVMNTNPFRLPAGMRGHAYEVLLRGTVPVNRVEVGTSIGELT